ncbi:MAG: DUF4160 domain-containing protein [Bacteroidota bacterium]
MAKKDNKFSVIERALAHEIAYFMSMSDAEIEAHIPNSRIKERVGTIGEYEVQIYSRDHEPPHFHVTSKGGLNAKFRIDDGSLMSHYGDLRSSVLKKINVWYKDMKTQTLLDTWNKRNRS